jgi:hypothetical protein
MNRQNYDPCQNGTPSLNISPVIPLPCSFFSINRFHPLFSYYQFLFDSFNVTILLYPIFYCCLLKKRTYFFAPVCTQSPFWANLKCSNLLACTYPAVLCIASAPKPLYALAMTACQMRVKTLSSNIS